jgi:hypothetical protein
VSKFAPPGKEGVSAYLAYPIRIGINRDNGPICGVSH